MRFVLDPNVLISALLTRDGAPAELLTRWLAGEFEAVASEALLAELESVLMREKFRPYVEVHEARAFVALVRASAMMVPDAGAPPRVSSAEMSTLGSSTNLMGSDYRGAALATLAALAASARKARTSSAAIASASSALNPVLRAHTVSSSSIPRKRRSALSTTSESRMSSRAA
jgi:predicted nucleic acid-binding protein